MEVMDIPSDHTLWPLITVYGDDDVEDWYTCPLKLNSIYWLFGDSVIPGTNIFRWYLVSMVTALLAPLYPTVLFATP